MIDKLEFFIALAKEQHFGRAEACQSMGGDAMHDRLRALLGIGWHATAKDSSVTLEPVYCLGLCACAPSAMFNGEVIGRLDAEKLDEIIEAVAA
jgi:formate dehydrogenase subunit gamma